MRIYFDFRPMDQEIKCFKIFLIYSSGCHLAQHSRTFKQFSQNYLISDQCFRRCNLIYFYLKLWWSSCLAEQNNLDNFGRGHFKNRFIIKLDQWFSSRKCRFKIFIIYSSGGHDIRQSGTV